MNRRLISYLATLLVLLYSKANGMDIDTTKVQYRVEYEKAYGMLNKMLQYGNNDLGMAVFYVENAYYNDSLSYEKFYKKIKELTELANDRRKNSSFLYPYADSSFVHAHAALFKIMTDSTMIIYNYRDTLYHLPYTYNFNDFDGSKDWSDMFVTKLMETHKGNCHSMPFLYKIIAQSLGLQTYFALAPNHIYIKLYNQQYTWYNTELTSAEFPIDAWIMASGYVHLSSIQNGIYMDTIGDKKSIALCLVDLAQGYRRRVGIDDGRFILMCCRTALDYYPNYINALLLQLDVYQTQFKYRLSTSAYNNFDELNAKDKDAEVLFKNIETLSQTIYNLGYRKMPESMYLQWLASLKNERDKYANKNIIFTNNNKKR